MAWRKWKPGASRGVLLVLAGGLWGAVGAMLLRTAWIWLADEPTRLVVLGGGGVAAACAWRFGFSRIARRNIERLDRPDAPRCLFAFQTWRSYGLILVMIALGYTLRHSPVPRAALAFVYLTIGGALLLAGLLDYGRRLLRRSAGA